MRERILEWFELNQLLGIEHFIVYNFSCTDPTANRLLRHYMKKGVVEVINWKPPIAIDRVGWPPNRHLLLYYGQVVAENDCMYRLMHRYRWAQFADIDEFLVPKKEPTLTGLMESVAGHKADTYIFRPFLFIQQYENYSATFEEFKRPILYTQLYTKRHPGLSRMKHNYKQIVELGRRGETMFVHNLYRFGKQHRLVLSNRFFFDTKIAALHHYRFIKLTAHENVPPIRDETMTRYKKPLLARLRRLENNLKNTL